MDNEGENHSTVIQDSPLPSQVKYSSFDERDGA